MKSAAVQLAWLVPHTASDPALPSWYGSAVLVKAAVVSAGLMLFQVVPLSHETSALTWHAAPELTLALNETTKPSMVAPLMAGMLSACHAWAWLLVVDVAKFDAVVQALLGFVQVVGVVDV